MITRVAIRFRGTTYSLPPPNRHHDVIRHIVETTGVSTVDAHGDDHGFIESSGAYLTRKQALLVAKAFGQLLPRATGMMLGKLYSEDIW